VESSSPENNRHHMIATCWQHLQSLTITYCYSFLNFPMLLETIGRHCCGHTLTNFILKENKTLQRCGFPVFGPHLHNPNITFLTPFYLLSHS